MTSFWTGVIVGVILGGFVCAVGAAILHCFKFAAETKQWEQDQLQEMTDCWKKIGKGGTD